jgi:hypothetical protein
VKQQLLLSPITGYRGYQPLGTNVTRHEAGFTPDWHEALDFFRWVWVCRGCLCGAEGCTGAQGIVVMSACHCPCAHRQPLLRPRTGLQTEKGATSNVKWRKSACQA